MIQNESLMCSHALLVCPINTVKGEGGWMKMFRETAFHESNHESALHKRKQERWKWVTPPPESAIKHFQFAPLSSTFPSKKKVSKSSHLLRELFCTHNSTPLCLDEFVSLGPQASIQIPCVRFFSATHSKRSPNRRCSPALCHAHCHVHRACCNSPACSTRVWACVILNLLSHACCCLRAGKGSEPACHFLH